MSFRMLVTSSLLLFILELISSEQLKLTTPIVQCIPHELCDNSTLGTGHMLFSELSSDVITIERCFSFCFTNSNVTHPEASYNFIPDIYEGDVCDNRSVQAFVCYAACLLQIELVQKTLNVNPASCEDTCNMTNGVCERALGPEAPCLASCKSELCSQWCVKLDNSFDIDLKVEESAYNLLMPEITAVYPEDIKLKKKGIMKFNISDNLFESNEIHGLIWNIGSHFVPQHYPFILLPNETNDTKSYRVGADMFAVRSLQCKMNNVSFTLVNATSYSGFYSNSESEEICFLGNWYPAPPQTLTLDLDIQRNGELLFKASTVDLSADDEYATGYKLQIHAPDGEEHCIADYFTEKNMTKLKNGVQGIYNGTAEVQDILPLIDRKSCVYLIGVSTEPHARSTIDGRKIYPNFKIHFAAFDFPQYPSIDAIKTVILVENPITGKYTISLNYTVTSHWKSLAVIWSLKFDVYCVQGTISRLGGASFLPASGDQLVYIIKGPDIAPSCSEATTRMEYRPRYRNRGITQKNLTDPVFSLLARQPSAIRNLTIVWNIDFSQFKFFANATFLGPEFPQGKILQYEYRLSTPLASIVDDGSLSVKDSEADSDMTLLNEVFVEVDLFEDDHFNFSVRAISEYDATGEWETVTIYPEFVADIPKQAELPLHIQGIIIGCCILAVVLVVLFILIVTTSGYYYYKKNKVVIVKNAGIWLNGQAEVDDEQDGTFEPLQLDNWEISPDQIIMDCMLGEGAFGEVYKGLIKGAVSNQYFSGIDNFTVAVKILREEASAALKSDFLKEIATMKKITMGSCPYVVNMVGCCTLQEPLALVLEYVPHGDLLTYLRTVRKLNNSSYFNMPESVQDIKGNEYVNHSGSGNPSVTPMTPMTPMTPASDCPLLLTGDGRVSQTHASPYERPYSTLGDLKPLHLISFAYQIASGMEFLSSLGLVHRDLACRNILIGENKSLKISDFGLARENEIYVKTTDGKLPLRWMAIECIVDRVFTTKSDVWSFGVVLWEITTLGGHPYPAIGNKALLASLLKGYRMEKPENCSEEIYKVMHQCWEAEALTRPSFSELRATFDTLLTGAQNASYIDLNVDEMLPYYSMTAVGADDDLEGSGEDFQPNSDDKDGYPDTKGIEKPNYIHSIEHLPDDASITSNDLSNMEGKQEEIILSSHQDIQET